MIGTWRRKNTILPGMYPEILHHSRKQFDKTQGDESHSHNLGFQF